MALYQVRIGTHLSEIDAFMACSYYQIADAVVEAAGESVLTTDQVSKLLYRQLTGQILKLEEMIKKRKDALERQQVLVDADVFENAQRREGASNELERIKDKLKELKNLLERKQKELVSVLRNKELLELIELDWIILYKSSDFILAVQLKKQFLVKDLNCRLSWFEIILKSNQFIFFGDFCRSLA